MWNLYIEIAEKYGYNWVTIVAIKMLLEIKDLNVLKSDNGKVGLWGSECIIVDVFNLNF